MDNNNIHSRGSNIPLNYSNAFVTTSAPTKPKQLLSYRVNKLSYTHLNGQTLLTLLRHSLGAWQTLSIKRYQRRKTLERIHKPAGGDVAPTSVTAELHNAALS